MSFMTYSIILYLRPLNHESPDDDAMRGKLIYQKFNCQSCHQIYGLGGYLGPDLTNVISAEGKGETVVRALVRQGVRQMPGFAIEDDELDALVAFLKSIDKTGKADPRTMQITNDGMIHNE